jgi:mono/diheme cytochrome c family protein
LKKIFIPLLFIISACGDNKDLNYEQYLVNGEISYKTHCANCHGAKGEGLKQLYPAINKSLMFNDTQKLICLIRNGGNIKNTQNGIEYDQAMPANKALYDIDVAELVSYLRHTYAKNNSMLSTDSVKIYTKMCK